MSNSKNQKGLSASSVREDLRIRFTEQLLQLREDEVTEVCFPSNLSNVERKFLHALAQELGLKSKSRGKGDDRFITVIKHATKTSDSSGIFFEMKDETKSILSSVLYNVPKGVKPSRRSKKKDHQKVEGYSNSVAETHFQNRQVLRENSPDYSRLQAMRQNLPASEHCGAVTSLIKSNRIVLISGETGWVIQMFIVLKKRSWLTLLSGAGVVKQPKYHSSYWTTQR
jgi:hypothetical protein